MSGATFGSDDIGAVVVDMGSNTIRVGYAGEEYPRYDIPSHYTTYATPTRRMCNFGTVALHSQTSVSEMQTFLNNGRIEDWNGFEYCIEYIFEKALSSDITTHPILFSEPAWAVNDERERLTEVMFEKYNIPAMYLAKTPTLIAYSQTKQTCLVLDSGATHTTASPVHDGVLVSQAVVTTPTGSDYILEQIKSMLINKGIEVVPYYRVAEKEVVRADDPASWRETSFKTTQTWHNYMVKEVLDDFNRAVTQVCETPFEEESVRSIPAVHYEFPNGYNSDFGMERFKVAEPLFNIQTPRHMEGVQPTCDISSLITNSVGLCDTEIRPQLFSNVIVTGGTSTLQGFTERLGKDLQSKMSPSMRLKLISPNDDLDRRFCPWLGGGILSTVPNFHSYWISREEYDEGGKAIVNIRC